MKRGVCAALALLFLIGVGFWITVAGLYAIGRLCYPRRYCGIVSECASRFSVPEAIVYAVIRTESGFDRYAVSHAGAQGLMQLMPSTYEVLARELGWDPALCSVFDPAVNIACGVSLLAQLYSKYRSWDIVAAAYNAGEPTVDRWLNDSDCVDNGRLLAIPYPETAAYTARVRRTQRIYETLYGAKENEKLKM